MIRPVATPVSWCLTSCCAPANVVRQNREVTEKEIIVAEYLIIDAHVHTYQTREIGLQAKQGSNITDYAGMPEELLPIMKQAEISQAVMVNMLPLTEMREAALTKLPAGLSDTERQEAAKETDIRMLSRLERRNSYTCNLAKEHANLIPFINLDPLMDEDTMITEILDKVNNHGAKGVKLHPSSQRFFPNDRHLWPAYRMAQQLSLPVVFHAGTFVTTIQYAQPKNFEEVLQSFPDLTLVMAHLGQGFLNEAISLARTYPNLQFDCSAIISGVAAKSVSDTDLTAVMKEIGVERIMFGSDFPWFDPLESIERLLRLDFSEREKQQILAENAIRIYELKP